MAVLYISEFSKPMDWSGGVVPITRQPSLRDQTVAVAASSAQSLAFLSGTQIVRIETDSICAVAFGTNPTAIVAAGTAGSMRMNSNDREYFQVNPGDKVAVIATS